MENNIYDPDYVKQLFNRMSSSYERMNFITSFGFSIRWRRQFLATFEQPGYQAEVIDLLTGMGETWNATRKALPNSRLTVLDFSEGMLKYARQKSRTSFNDEVIVLQQDILENKLPTSHFDFVTCAFGLKTFSNAQLETLALETKRILKPGGHFSFVEVSKPDNRLLRALYGFYLGKVIPILGNLLLADPEEYKMLWRYTDKFENAKNASDIFSGVGLATNFISHFWGCATGFHGQKISEPGISRTESQ